MVFKNVLWPSLGVLGGSLGVLGTNLVNLSGHAGGQCWRAGRQSGRAALINPVCYTREATTLLVQLDVLCIVAGKQQEHTSIYIIIYNIYIYI